jgi:hypothetical protein
MWLKEKRIPILPSISATILHRRVQDRPTQISHSDKKSMHDLLIGKKIPFSANIFKTDPYEFIKLKTPHFKYYINVTIS